MPVEPALGGALLLHNHDLTYSKGLSKVITSSRNLTTATGDVSYTGVGFTPTSIVALSIVNGASLGYSIGFSDSAKTAMCTYKGGDSNNYISAEICHVTPSGGGEQYATIKSYDADGFTLTWTKSASPTGTVTLHFLCSR